MKLTVKDLEELNHVQFINKELVNKTITGVSTDTRTIKKGDLFFALRGENFDGHKFVENAFIKGATAAVVDATFTPGRNSGHPILVVTDTTKAFGELAQLYRKRFDIPVIAIGGSNGKTTTKEMIVRTLRSRYSVLSTQGNLNNHIGVPHTLLRLQKKHELAVVEIGTNHPGEIDYLCRILAPTHGLVTNIGREHLEFFKSVDGVANEEGVLFEHLRRRKKSVAFVNADDERVVAKARSVKKRVTYGMIAKRSAVRGKVLGINGAGCAQIQFAGSGVKKGMSVRLRIPGEHNVVNALAAAAVGLTFKVSPQQIRKALQSFRPADKRMQVLNIGGVIIFNDTYNANPDSTLAALHTLASTRVTGKRIAVLADMRELGELAVEEHRRVGNEVARLGIAYLLTYGELARHIHQVAQMQMAYHYTQKNMLAEYLAELIAPGDAVLVKGSRGMKMEDVVTFLEERLHSALVPFG
jgi:UDP-N-acetylmuramoyl-tripeptide--D-alanyl-D-alanine ligase